VAAPPPMTRPSLGAQILQRIRFVIAQVWVPRSDSLLEPMDVLPTAAELAAGFKVVGERRWRTGISTEPWASRAKMARSVTAWRSFSDGGDRWLWIQAMPLTNDEDAKSAIGNLWSLTMANLGFRGRVLETRPGPRIAALGSDTSTMEQDVAMGEKLFNAKYMAWRYGSVISALCAAGPGDAWTWDALSQVAEGQSRRVEQRR
jgi:hypothetical protein